MFQIKSDINDRYTNLLHFQGIEYKTQQKYEKSNLAFDLQLHFLYNLKLLENLPLAESFMFYQGIDLK